MSSATAAARPGYAMPRIPLWFVVLALMLAVVAGIAAGSAIARSAAAPNVADTSAPVRHHAAFTGAVGAQPTTIVRYRQLVTSLSAAEANHDAAGAYRFESQLDQLLTPQAMGTVYAEHARLMAALGSANRDSHAALITREIAKLCGPAAVKAQLDFCN